MWSGATLTCEIWQLIMHIASSFYVLDPFERRILQILYHISYITSPGLGIYLILKVNLFLSIKCHIL